MFHILAVDDSQIMRDLVKEALESSGYKVTIAENGEDGLRKFKESNFDLIITDINMPIMDGITMIHKIRKLNKEIPIITLTTESEEAKKQEGRKAGANGWITKPFIFKKYE